MEAEPIGVAAGKVIFEKAHGKRCTYALNQLIQDDRAYLKQWFRTSKTSGNPLQVTRAEAVLTGK
ncbi:MAG: hypothetical protein ABF370_15765 [Verrucomicrobiales bacterium]